jgi:hypothetical protein
MKIITVPPVLAITIFTFLSTISRPYKYRLHNHLRLENNGTNRGVKSKFLAHTDGAAVANQTMKGRGITSLAGRNAFSPATASV